MVQPFTSQHPIDKCFYPQGSAPHQTLSEPM